MPGYHARVRCDRPGCAVPVLSHAVMGNMAYNLLRTGVRLQRRLEGICTQPLLRRTMGTLSTGIGIDKGTGVSRRRLPSTSQGMPHGYRSLGCTAE